MVVRWLPFEEHPSSRVRLSQQDVIETNIVRVDLSHSPLDAAAWERGLGERGIRVGAYGPEKPLRLVTHRHVDAAAIERVLAQVSGLLRNKG